MPYTPSDTTDLLQNTDPSVLNRQLNPLQANSFELVMDMLKFKNAEFMVQTVSLPDIQAGPTPVTNSMRNLPFRPDKIEYTPLQLSFLIDEYMVNYQEIHDWILASLIAPDDTRITRDLTLIIKTSSNNVAREIKFIDAFPTSLSSIPFDTTVTDIQVMNASVTFEYSYYRLS